MNALSTFNIMAKQPTKYLIVKMNPASDVQITLWVITRRMLDWCRGTSSGPEVRQTGIVSALTLVWWHDLGQLT